MEKGDKGVDLKDVVLTEEHAAAVSLRSSGGKSFAASRQYSTKSTVRKKDDIQTRILDLKIREVIQKQRIKDRQYRRKLINKQRRVQEELEYLKFPTLVGFYFDGFPDYHFLLCKEWADIFNELEEDQTRKKELDPKETFAEQVRRNFWPPRIVAGCMFRTRGIYLDCREVMRDPPREPPDPRTLVALSEDLEGSLVGEVDAEGAAGQAAAAAAAEAAYLGVDGGAVAVAVGEEGGGDTAGQTGQKRKKFGHYYAKSLRADEINKHDFYFDEDMGKWYLRKNKDPNAVYFDQRYQIWRLKRSTLKYNGDWYFDTKKGKFELKIRDKGVYTFDNVWNVWKIKNSGEDIDSYKGHLPKDYFYSELHAIWRLRKDVPNKAYSFDENGWRFASRIPITGPDDFFFDESGRGEFILKTPGQGKSYYYDQEFHAWRKIGGENHRCRLHPSNYYWSDSDCVFKLKDGPRILFDFDTNNRFYRKKKILQGKHHPSNWRWNLMTKQWELKPAKRPGIFSQLLHWRPLRDYDKPWQDNDGWQYNYINLEKLPPSKVQEATETAEGAASAKGAEKFPKTDDEAFSKAAKEGLYGKRAIDVALGKAVEEEMAEWDEEDFKKSGQRIPFDSPAKDLIDFTSARKAIHREKLALLQAQAEAEGEPIPTGEVVEVVDRTIDRKRLRCGNLGSVINEKELKSFFYAARLVTRPKNQDPKDKDDFMYIHFPSDNAATAAYKTMQGVDIKGQRIVLSYPRRFQR